MRYNITIKNNDGVKYLKYAKLPTNEKMTEYHILKRFKMFIPFDIGFSFQESSLK